MTTEERLHAYARQKAATLSGVKPKLIRWNDIVATAMRFYPRDPFEGVAECLRSCIPGDPMYDGKNTLPLSLQANYEWMLA